MATDTQRKLAAILSADVVGYSRLIAADEAGTLDALRSHRTALLEPKITEHDGRVVKLMGDGVLAEFPSAVEAVRCAVEIQHTMRERNEDVEEDRQIIFRIGINIGDIVIEGDDILGDGVNIAARLEAVAEPGGIHVSRNVYDQVKNKLDLSFKHLGEQQLKNIAEPVSVFRVVLDDKSAALVSPVILPAASSDLWRRPAVTAAVVMLLIVAGGLVWWHPWAQREEPAVVERMAQPLPEKPSIAVLPFDNLSGEPEQSYFADGMTDDLITDLSKLSGLFVISRNSTFTYKNRPVKIRKVAEELGVRYVLEGSVRRAGDQLRINVQLIDALTGYHIWAERYDGFFADVFKLQDKVVGEIVAAMSVSLTSAESAQTAEAETTVPAAYDAVLKGRELFRRNSPEDLAKAIGFFEKAIELDPDYSRAYAGLAAIYWFAYDTKWDVHLGIEYEALKLAEANLAKALEQPTSEAHQVSALILAARGRNDDALEEVDRAIELEPNNPDGLVIKSWVLVLLGRAEEAETAARLAMRLNPGHGASSLRALARALFFQQRDAEAADVMKRSIDLAPDFEFAYHFLAAMYGHIGRIEDARAAISEYNRLTAETRGGELTIADVERLFGGDWFDLDESYLAHWVEGLRKAGTPEGVSAQIENANFEDLVTRTGGRFDVAGAVKIDAAGAKALFDRRAVFIDARGSSPFGRGHVPGAINLPYQALTKEGLLQSVKPDQDVVFYCGGEDCSLSANSCAKALTWGYSKVYYFAVGFPAWKAAGYQLEKTSAE